MAEWIPSDWKFTTSFGSDNHSGIHPQILDFISKLNHSHAPSYGTDSVTEATQKAIDQLFQVPNQSFFVFNGTAANVLALNSCVQSHHSILCADVSHLNVDECGAPEKHIGCKLITLPTTDGKIRPEQIEEQMIRLGDQHYSQPKAVSITQPTELGTVYSLEELQAIGRMARKHQLYFHIDGARLANAVVSLNTSFYELVTQSGVDVLSWGGTKNGLLGVECVVITNLPLAKNFKYLRKQAMQLPSKMRFFSGQFLCYIQSGLWKEIAHHSLKMAQELAQGLEVIPEVFITQKVQSNALFPQVPKEWISPLRKEFFFYVWTSSPSGPWVARWMTSFDTTKEDVNQFLTEITRLSKKRTQQERAEQVTFKR